MFAWTILFAAVVLSSALPVKQGEESYGAAMSVGDMNSFLEKYNIGQSIQNEMEAAITAELTKKQSEQQIVFGGLDDQGFNWNGIQNTQDATLPKFSDNYFDWQQYLETAEEGTNGQNVNQIATDTAVEEMMNTGMLANGGSFWNGIQNTDDAALPKFSDADFDWQQYLETTEQGGTGQNLNQIAEDVAVQEMMNNGLLPDNGSFDMQKYMDDINKEMEELGLNE